MTRDDSLRYSRQISLPEVGADGQERLSNASVLVVGAGGLGSPALQHLVGAGVGRIGIVEFDRVDVSNLHRQTLYSTKDLGRPKVEAAIERLSAVNPRVDLVAHPEALGSGNATRLLSEYELVVDGSDTFDTRYVVNDASVATGVPTVFASVSRFSGQASVFGAKNGPCYRCLFPSPPPPGLIPNCADGGVLGVVPGIMGGIQAAEALKWMLGIGEPLVGRLLLVDVLTMESRIVTFERDPDCPACGPTRQSLASDLVPQITVDELRARLADCPDVPLLDVREASERQQDQIGGRFIPLGMLDVRTFELDDWQDRPIVVYCAAGGRSAQAARLLRQRGFDAVSLHGGLSAWRALEQDG